MASLGHIAVGLAATRIYEEPPDRRTWITAALVWSALSFLPDADVIGFAFGVRYEDEWGHRGATHSLAFSAMLGTLVGLVAPRLRLPAWRTGVLATLVLASHAILDTFTDGGLGIALFWPFDVTRYFAPWRPIPVSPIGLAFLSPYGLFVAAWEALIFAPVWWYSLSRSRTAGVTAPRAAAAGVWLVLLWLMISTTDLRDRVLAAVLRDDTEYTGGFSEDRLGRVERGQTEEEVRALLGDPYNVFEFPIGTCWVYSRPADGAGFYRARGVCFANGRVDEVVRRWVR